MRKSKDQKLINEAIEFFKNSKLDEESHIFNQHSDQSKIKCVEYIQRGLSLSQVSEIFGVPRSTLSGWKYRVESVNCNKPLKTSSSSRVNEKITIPTNIAIDKAKSLKHELDINKLVEVRVARSSLHESEPNIEFHVSSKKLNLSIKNLNLLSAKELMKEYLQCLSMKEI